ncbi:hypothetical protein BH09GEM1_BH09GEM1_18230 [soil metagenome]
MYRSLSLCAGWRCNASRVALFAMLVHVGIPTSIAAQRLAPAGVLLAGIRDSTARDSTTFTPVSARVDTLAAPDDQMGARIGIGVVGALLGTLAGGEIGSYLSHGCHGELCGLSGVLSGAAVGSVAVGALVAALPSLGSKCTAEDRLGFAVGGGLAGAVTGGAIGLIGGPLCILTYILGSGVGAGMAVASCG